jgi:hypothetical protein
MCIRHASGDYLNEIIGLRASVAMREAGAVKKPDVTLR